jgi:hypothetical protein
MADKPWWAAALQWSLWWIAMIGVMGWLGRSRMAAAPPAPGTLRLPRSVAILGAVCRGFFVALLVLSHVYANGTEGPFTDLVFGGFALLSLPMLLDYWFARHVVDDDGLSYWTWLGGGRRHMRWDRVREVRYAPTMKWFRVRDADGRTARISAMMCGLPAFAALLLTHAPQAVADPFTRDMLHATVAGSPPPVW